MTWRVFFLVLLAAAALEAVALVYWFDHAGDGSTGETVAYWAGWLIPVALLVAAVGLVRRSRSERPGSIDARD